MITSQEHVQEKRSRDRIALQCAIILANGTQVGQGQVLNMSERGCLCVIDGPLSIKIRVGDRLQLRLFLPDSDQSLCVSLAVVRWVEGFQFGVEFSKLDEKYRAGLNEFIALQEQDPWKLAL
jgi:c-di-GMP-binding flagellar brake protein YcgR